MKGTLSKKHKVTAEQVREIRRRLAEGERPSRLAKEFGLSQGYVSNIKAGRTWAGA